MGDLSMVNWKDRTFGNTHLIYLLATESQEVSGTFSKRGVQVTRMLTSVVLLPI